MKMSNIIFFDNSFLFYTFEWCIDFFEKRTIILFHVSEQAKFWTSVFDYIKNQSQDLNQLYNVYNPFNAINI